MNGPVAVVGRTGGHLVALGLGDGGERSRLALDVRVPLPHPIGARVAVVAGWADCASSTRWAAGRHGP